MRIRPGQIAALCADLPISAGGTWTDQPSAATLLLGSAGHIAKADLSGFTEARLVAARLGTAGNAGSKIILRYRTTHSTTASDYSDIGTSEVSVSMVTADTYVASAWVPLATAARADVWVAVIGTGGDGAADPVLGSVHAQFRT